MNFNGKMDKMKCMFNPHHSYKNAVNYMNRQWTKEWKTGNPEFEMS